MFARVHPPEDVQSGNTGSCLDLVHYLGKESAENPHFFSHTQSEVTPEEVIKNIDGNHSKLSATDAKFYMLSLNPSQEEQIHLIGRKVGSLEELTPEERKEVFRKLENFTRSSMNEYALNFQRNTIKGGQDLMYFAKIETKRYYHPTDEEVKKGLAKIGEEKPGLNMHVHIIVSRKSQDGKVKLSPAAKSAGNSWELEGRGTVKRGFSHENWKVRVQEQFNRLFAYQAKDGEFYLRREIPDTIQNQDLKTLLEEQQFTAANQIIAAMKEQGHLHEVRAGLHTFSKDGNTFQVEHKLLKNFERPLSYEQMKSITDRFDLTKYEANPETYRENGLQIKEIRFSTYAKNLENQQDKNLKEVSYKVIYDEQNKITVSFATVKQYAYENRINLVKSEPTAEAVLKKIKNPDLKKLLVEYRFTSANQIIVAMKKEGYSHRVRKGVHTFSNEGRMVSIRHKDLKKFADPNLNGQRMEDIIGRFNLYKYKQEGIVYRENGLQAENISFKTYQKIPIEDAEESAEMGERQTDDIQSQEIRPQENNASETTGQKSEEVQEAQEEQPEAERPKPVRYRKELKEVSYDVLFDEQTKTYVPISSVRKYAYENGINLFDRYKHSYAIRNEDLRSCLENPEYQNVRQIHKAMRERGYAIERDKTGNYIYTKGEKVFTMERRDLLAFTGYAKDSSGRDRQGRNQNESATNRAIGLLGGKAKQELINEILGDNFRTERMIAGNVRKVASVIKNPANIKMILIKQIGSFLNPFKEL